MPKYSMEMDTDAKTHTFMKDGVAMDPQDCTMSAYADDYYDSSEGKTKPGYSYSLSHSTKAEDGYGQDMYSFSMQKQGDKTHTRESNHKYRKSVGQAVAKVLEMHEAAASLGDFLIKGK